MNFFLFAVKFINIGPNFGICERPIYYLVKLVTSCNKFSWGFVFILWYTDSVL